MASADDIVPPAMSRNYVSEKRRERRCASGEIANAGHFEIVDPRSQAWAEVEKAVLDFLSKALITAQR